MTKLAAVLVLALALLVNAIPAFAEGLDPSFGPMISQHALEHAIQSGGDFGQCVAMHATTGSCPDL